MITEMKNQDIKDVMNIWLNENISAHGFIEKKYWLDNFENVKSAISNADVYIYKSKEKICGFIGLEQNYIAGIFVDKSLQRKGIGKALLDHVKQKHDKLSLNVYEKNIGAVKFYKREDFEISDESIDVTTGEKEYLMTWQRKGGGIHEIKC